MGPRTPSLSTSCSGGVLPPGFPGCADGLPSPGLGAWLLDSRTVTAVPCGEGVRGTGLPAAALSRGLVLLQLRLRSLAPS